MKKQKMINHINMLATMKKALERNRGNWPAIAIKAKVSYSWLIHVMSGHTKNPRIQECQRVLDVLHRMAMKDNPKPQPSTAVQ